MRNRLSAVAVCLMLALSAPAISQAVPVRGHASTPDVAWVSHGAIYEVFVRDFSPTGNFRGVIAGLDKIKAVGANIVWLMPIYPVGVANRKGSLGSPYAVYDYRAVNPEFGTMADFKALVAAVHARGMKLILDWVPNHTAWDNVMMTNKLFYKRDAAGNITPPNPSSTRLAGSGVVVRSGPAGANAGDSAVTVCPRFGVRAK